MKLIVKLPKGKPPFIGLLFPDLPAASKQNDDLVDNYQKETFRIAVEFMKNYAHLRLICEEKLIVRFYRNINYDTEKLKVWIYLTQNARDFNFGHVYEHNGKEVIAKTIIRRKNFVLKLDCCEFFEGSAFEKLQD